MAEEALAVNNPETLFWEGPYQVLATPQGPCTSFSPSYLVQAGDETRRETGEPKALFNGGEAALEVGAVEELGELEKPVAQHKHLWGGGGWKKVPSQLVS